MMPDKLDPFVRHQVYVEGYKNGEAAQADATFDEIVAIIIILATKLSIDNLGDLTKRQLTAFVSEVRAQVKKVFNRDADITMNNIEKFMGADINVTGNMLNTMLDKPVPYNTVNLSWSTVDNTPIAGAGIEPSALVAATLAASIADIIAKIKMGYADKQSVGDFIRELVGTKSLKYKDGLALKLKRRWATSVETIIQHTTSLIAFKLQSLVSDKYTWCAILDNNTTAICRERNGNVYEYATGPRPPAHYRCRSFIVPVTITALADMPTFYTWVKRQPAGIQDDVLGPGRGLALRGGRLKSDELTGFDHTRPLTVDQYASKVKQILSEVA